ncbi:MAG: VWA domain-containing protein [Spirochaetaceae bacterium]|nr:MAG: VWA domain-containing protein [Spirochaetaceae bacterium]
MTFGQEIDMEAAQAFEDFRWGLRAFHSGNFEDSILSLEKSLSRKPQDLRTRYWLGSALYRAGFEDAALAEWRYVLKGNPGNTVVDNTIDVLTYRRGLGEQLEERTQLVVASVIDGQDSNAYPLRRPSSVCIREDGSVYLVAFASNEVLLLDVNNAVQKVFQGGIQGFDRPYDCLEVEDPEDGERFLFVTEYGRNQVLKMNLRGDRVHAIGARGSAPGEFLGPQYLAADGDGYLYVCDWGNGRVNKYDFDGNFVLSIGRSSNLKLSGPTGITYQEGQLFVADRDRKRIIVYDDSGNSLYGFGEGILTGPEGIAFYDRDHLLVVDGFKLLEYNLRQETWVTLSDLSSFAGRLTHLSISPNGEVYVVDFGENKVYILSEMAALYTSLNVQIERINSLSFPDITVEVTVEDRRGRPIVGLQEENFIFSEFFAEIPAARLLLAPGDPTPLELSLVVEKSPGMREYIPDLAAAVESLYEQLGGSTRTGSWSVLSAGEQVVVERELGASRLESVQAARSGPWSTRWRLDRGLRLATSQLISSKMRMSRKAVVLLTTGTLHRESFSDFSLAEVTDYLQNNGIPLYVVYFGPQPDRELEYICSQTGGSVVSYFAPRSAAALIDDIRRRLGSRYLLELRSRTDSGFGKNYIDFQTEVAFHRKSGRTQSGYFAPLSE